MTTTVDLREFEFGQIVGPIFVRDSNKLLPPLAGEEFHYLAGRQQIFARDYVHPRNDPQHKHMFGDGTNVSAGVSKTPEVNRMYFAHSTGTGKTSKSLHVARQYLQIPGMNVIILGFDNTKEVFINEAMKFPEHGYISHADYTRYLELRAQYDRTKSAIDMQAFRTYHQRLRSKITGRTRGSKIDFYGYQEFANRVGFRDESITDPANVVINHQFVATLKGGMIIADEIRNAYNTDGLNSRGLALKHVSDALREDIHIAVMSATPMYNTAQESIDLAQFLNYGKLERRDYFRDEQLIDEAGFIKLFENRVSVYTLRENNLYPERRFPSDAAALGPIDPREFAFIKCPASEMQMKALRAIQQANSTAIEAADDVGANSSTYFLRDFALPDPEDPSQPLLTTGDLNAHFPGGNLPTEYLSGDGLKRYFPKYARLIADLRQTRGKTMIFHPRVQWAAKLIEQILEANNYVQGDTAPNAFTPCALCSLMAGEHKLKNQGHVFTPSKFAMLHSELDRSRLAQTRAEYNSTNNLNGTGLQHIVASKLVAEGYDFNAIQHMFIIGFPDTYHMLQQVFGRADRRRSHLALPAELRNVTIHIYVTVAPDGQPAPFDITPERYIIKWPTYVAINKIMTLFADIAVDREIYREHTHPQENGATVDGNIVKKHKYYTRGLFTDEIANLNRVVKRLFLWRAMWKFDDLVAAVREPPISVNVDVSQSSLDTIKYVINNIIYYPNDKAYLFSVDRFVHSNTRAATLFNFENNGKFFINRNSVMVVVVVGELLMLRPVDVLSRRISSHPINPVTHMRFRINLMADEVTKLIAEKTPTPALFKEYGADVHEDAIRALVAEGATSSLLLKMYMRLGIVHMKEGRRGDDENGAEYWKNTIGYRLVGDSWVSFAVERPTYSSIIGYYESMQFKIFDVRSSSHGAKKEDAREYGRGVSCMNKPPSELRDIAKALSITLDKSITTLGMCLAIEKRLLQLQFSEGGKSTYFMFFGAP